jgi:pimeloyl-ACP methyl ester carboxylesterase
VLLLHGGPGLPDYLSPIAAMIEDLTVVHRYDQRGTGGSPWEGQHTLERHMQDIDELLDGWNYEQIALVGHSDGTDLAARYCLRRPGRVAGLVLLAGPFLEPWREADRRTREQRMTEVQRARLAELDAADSRTEEQEQERLSLSWFPDHHDPERAWSWAARAARTRRPVNWVMNSQISSDRSTARLEDRLDDLAAVVPAATVIIGGAGDPRPAAALERLGRRLGRPTVIIPRAGHEPWLAWRPTVAARTRGSGSSSVSETPKGHLTILKALIFCGGSDGCWQPERARLLGVPQDAVPPVLGSGVGS